MSGAAIRSLALALACGFLADHARAGSPELNVGPVAGGVLGTSNAAAESGETAVTRDGAPEPDDTLSVEYPVFGVASHFMAQVYVAPSERAQVYGYVRRGAGLRLRPGVSGPGCDTQWHAVFGGGYVCAGRGVSLELDPASITAPAPPMQYQALPYAYAKLNLVDGLMYARPPTAEEEREVAASIAQARKLGLEPTPVAKMPPPAPKKPAAKALAPTPSPITLKLLKGNPKALAAAKAALAKKALTPKPPERPVVPPKPLSQLKALPDIVRMLLQPGFYVSLDESAAVTELDFVRTVRGDFLRLPTQDRVRASAWQGSLLPERPQGPLALVSQPNATSFQRNVLTGELTPAEPLRPLDAVELGDEVIVRKGKRFLVTLDGRIVADSALRLLPLPNRPQLVPSRARWIEVNLEQQTLVAYEGERPVYATLVSSGKAGYETPVGVYRIQSKHVSTTMDGEAFGDEEAYSIEDVPWVMYFSGSIALHAAFWHEKFGRPRSHGCVNLAPLDARWLFEWAGPRLPAGFHGILSTAERPGTFVVVTR